MEPRDAEAAAVEQWATKLWGADAPLTKVHIAFARHECPTCGGPLTGERFRRCAACRVDWFAQFAEPDGRARPGSYISDAPVVEGQ